MKKCALPILLMLLAQYATAQNWNTTGNSGLTSSNFFGTIDSKDVIFKANNAERGRLASTGFWRFGNATNFAKIDSAGKLTFGGNGAYQVAGDKYAFQYTGNTNYGLFFNSTNVQYEFRNGTATPVFYVNANNGNGTFNGTLKVGAYTFPATDGMNGQVLKTNGSGVLAWSADNNNIYTAGSGINITGNIISTTAPAAWGMTGNAGTNPDINFIGTTDAQPLVFKVNNQKAGYIDYDYPYNAGWGYQALFSNTNGDRNTANGYWALYSNTSGSSNTVNGMSALYYNTTGSFNTANGTTALYLNTTGSYNTAIGSFALTGNTASGNTASGAYALYSNTTGSSNTAHGMNGLAGNSTGFNNTASGSAALFGNTTGSYNTANGSAALYQNGKGSENTASGAYALFSNTGSGNTAYGRNCLYYNKTGYSNIAVGFSALYKNEIGHNLVAVGDSALYNQTENTSGIYENTAIGSKALYSNTIGYNNTANGYHSLYNNTTGFNNIANGGYSLHENTTGFSNTATGFLALTNNTTGSDNTAAGVSTLVENTTGFYNTASGSNALNKNTQGTENTASGALSLYLNTTGSRNAAIGVYSMSDNTTGSDNTALGYNTGVLNGDLNNTISIGSNTYVDASNKARIGNADITSIGGQVGWTSFSDGRYKKNIKEDVQGLKFINILKPITYTVDINGLNNYYDKNRKHDSAYNKINSGMQSSADAAAKIIYDGFIAQDVEKAAKSINYNFSGVDKPQNKDGLYGLRYADFVVPLVKAVQELSKMNNDKDAKIDSLQKQMNDLRSLVLQIQQQQQSCSPCSVAAGTSTNSNAVNQNSITLSDAASLSQNVPNPFKNTTTISYELPQKFSSAKIIVTDRNGRQLKQLNLSATGKGTVNVDASTLASGAYNYSLYVDGRLIATKQMISAK